MNELALKIPPQAVECEKHILGACFLDVEAALQAFEAINAAEFYTDCHRTIFDALRAVYERYQKTDILTLFEELKSSGKEGRAGGEGYLLEISAEVVTSGDIIPHIQIVKDKARKREQIAIAGWLMEAGYGVASGADIQAEAERRVFQLSDKERAAGCLRPVREVLVESFAAIARMQSGELTGLKTGLKSVDAHMAGMQAGDLIVLSGRPGQGKTSIGAQIGINVAKDGGVVPFFECEMKDRAIVDRALFAEANISHQLFKHGKVPESRFIELKAAADKIKDIPFFINDSAGITPMQIRAGCRRLKRERGRLDLIIVDNIQRMKSDLGTSDVRVRTGEISAALKEIAKEFNVPVIAVSHLRRLSNGEGTEPTLADLQESGNIEQDADIVLSLFNLSLYKEVPDGEEGRVKLSFLKYREGSLGYVDLYFEKTITTFMDWEDRPKNNFNAEAFTRGIN